MDISDAPEPRRFSFPAAAHSTAFALLFANLILSPWAYGSWEAWWFWPMLALIFAAGLFSGVGALAETVSIDSRGWSLAGRFRNSKSLAALGLCAAPFLIYAAARATFPSAPDRPMVEMETDRCLMLVFSPVVIAFVSFFSLTRRRLRFICRALVVNILVIAAYASISQYLTYGLDKQDYVMWTPTEWDYGDRAKGPFFCPNHLSAFLNLGLCLLLAYAFTPAGALRKRAAAGALALALFAANFFTLSRGGLASAIAGLALGFMFFAMRGRKLWLRIAAPALAIAAAAAVGAAIVRTDNPVMERVKSHPLYKVATAEHSEPGEFSKRLRDTFWHSFDRGQYIGAALRVWRSNPVWGVGPGQHSNRWTEFAATDYAADGGPVVHPENGDYSQMRRPRMANDNYHLYEVHSDWTQLLEEFGAVGFALFLPPILLVFILLYNSQTLALRKASEPPAEQKTSDADADGDGDSDAEEAEAYAVRRGRSRSRHRRHSRRGATSAASTPWRSDEAPAPFELSLPLAGLFACLVLAVHSLGDFSLQIPSITWAFAFMLAAGILAAARTHR